MRARQRAGGGRASRRSRRARERQLDYQRKKATAAEGREAEYIETMRQKSATVRAALELVRSLPRDARVLEVGSGAHGLVFYFGSPRAVGCDPLAREYAAWFPVWQREVPTLAAEGEALPFADATFDVVLCDNVVDHAESPERIASEISRVLAPGGLLYFTVNVHHRVYAWIARALVTLDAVGLPLAFGPFADHTVHLTPDAVRALFAGLPVEVVSAHHDPRARRSEHTRRRVANVAKALFFKNALFQLVAVRMAPPSPTGTGGESPQAVA